MALVLTFQWLAEMLLKRDITADEAHDQAYGRFAQIATKRCGINEINQLLLNGKSDFALDLKAYDTFGSELPLTG